MNTYLLPVEDKLDIWIEKVSARNFEEAKEKFINTFIEMYPGLEDCSNWEELGDKLANIDVFFGDIYDIEEF